jgi:peptide-methionine (S)-S-oxide reductase
MRCFLLLSRIITGCYWGTEKFIVKDFQKKFPGSIKDAKVGFMSPDPNAMVNPSYRQVCSGTTGHVEVLMIELADPTVASSSTTSSTCTSTEQLVEELLRFFFLFHDPTTKNRQGNDAGTQYASAIFCADEAQKKIAQSVKDELQQLLTSGKVKASAYAGKTIETYIADQQTFYPAQ